jgi:MFS transporter, MHS family, citrate/tricarballylate:H+ symporter
VAEKLDTRECGVKAGVEKAPASKGTARFAIAVATVGSALEWYDFLIYAFFSIQIGHAFFPSHDPYTSLMLSLTTFGAGFITRPIGGIIVGTFADRVGRRPALMLSLTLMGASILFLAFLPSYNTIGIAAPLLAVVARMVQGFSFGGQVGTTTAYLLETAPLGARGAAVAWQSVSANVATVVAGLVGVGLTATIPPAVLDAYGWRIAFLIGAVALPFALWMQRGLPETLHLPVETGERADAGRSIGVLRDHARVIVLSLTVAAAIAVSFNLLHYLTTFAQYTLHMPQRTAFWAETVGALAGTASVLIGGRLCDRIGRRPVMIWPNLAYLLLIGPMFYWIIATRNPWALITGLGVFGFFSQMGGAAFFCAVTESLPKTIRGGTFATIHASSTALFGGTTPLVITWLIHRTGSPMAPAWYLIGVTAIGLVARMLFRESAPAKSGATMIVC